jgi:tRNA pseudouridine32 synthase / 23S rRNA pseudouridine746 synthase
LNLVSPSLDVLFEDAHMLVLNKPAGLLAVPGRGPDKQDCLSSRALAVWPDALVVHRLDMATSGVVLMARGIEAQRRLSLAFEKRRVYKRYLAMASGTLPSPQPGNDWNTIELPLLIDWENRPRSIVNHDMGKPSTTMWRPAPDATAPVQLRVHLQAIGHPIVGDPLYAAPDAPAQATRLLLHAQALAIAHPATGERLWFEAPCPF